jgi:hypothetical protein
MKRVVLPCLWASLWACAAVIGAGVAPAASPQVDAAIRAVEAVAADPARLKLFCELNKLLLSGADSDDPETEKQTEAIVAQMGPDFSAAWDVGEELDENTPDGQAFYGAVDALADKCQ